MILIDNYYVYKVSSCLMLVIKVEPEVMEGFGFNFFYFYSTLATEERVESLVYDFSNFLVATGFETSHFYSELKVSQIEFKLFYKQISIRFHFEPLLSRG